jgi:hypothetical protein
MTTTEHQILAEIATTGQAVIQLFKPREAKAAETLRSHRIIHVDAGNDLIWVVKFGPAPFGHQAREIV